MNNRLNRWAGALLLLLTFAYVPWLIRAANRDALWLSIPFVVANTSVLIGSLLHWFNNWERTSPLLHHVRRGREPEVAVIIPTYGEPLDMVMKTASSVLEQDYPIGRITLVVSDDEHSAALGECVGQLAELYPAAAVLYHRPPAKTDPSRKGEGKAGNLNSAVARLAEEGCEAPFVETRDADDLVGDPSFLRVCVGQLQAKPDLAFVQTVKTAEVPAGDPFGNLNPTFYQAVMFAKNAAGAVFPCGSGLVWRADALRDIDGFPEWNLVEDVQSGINAMQRGWRGESLGIVGAHAQHAPEDLPNVFKQRGTWALDTMRLMFWGSLRGLSLRQRLHFYETNLFYLNSFAWITLMLATVLTLITGKPLLVDDQVRITVFLWSMFAALELFHAAHSYDHGFVGLWRNRQVWANLSFLWAVQVVRALIAGPNHKPIYRVTRKVADHRVHLGLVAPQIVAIVALVAAVAIWARRWGGLGNLDASGLYWAMFFLLLYGSFLPRAWFGVGSQLQAPRLALRWSDIARRVAGAPDTALGLASITPSGTAPVISLGAPAHSHRAPIRRFLTDPAEPAEPRLREVPKSGYSVSPRLRIGVMGAGIGGLTVARLLRDSGHEVAVFESSDHCGGLAASFRWHGVDCDHGPHRFLPDDDAIVADLATLVPLRTLVRSSRIRLRGRWVREPINPFELVLKFLPRRGMALVWGFVSRDRNGPENNFDEQSVQRFGKGLNEMFFRPYSEKLFGIPATEISPDWGRRKLRAAGFKDLLNKRSRLSFQEFYYPCDGGYGAIVGALEAQVGDQIRFQQRLVRLERYGDAGYLATFERADRSTRTEPFDLVVSTLPAPAIAAMLGTPLELRFRPVDLYYLHIARPQVTPHHWFYFADGLETSVVNRVTEFTNFGNASAEPGTTVLCCEVTETPAGSVDRVIGELVGAKLISAQEVLDSKVVHIRNAYPIYDLRSDEELPRMAALFEQHPDLFHVGRSATFAHEDIDEIYVQARAVVDTIVARVAAGRTIDLRHSDRFDQARASTSRTAS